MPSISDLTMPPLPDDPSIRWEKSTTAKDVYFDFEVIPLSLPLAKIGQDFVILDEAGYVERGFRELRLREMRDLAAKLVDPTTPPEMSSARNERRQGRRRRQKFL